MYETFDHTADLGLRVTADALPTLFAEAAEALFSVMVVNLGDVALAQSRQYRIDGTEHDLLLFDWLTELLYAFETEGLLFRRFEIRFDETGLTATAVGEPLDWDRHRLDHEVKAITYHDLRVQPTAAGYLAEVIVDI